MELESKFGPKAGADTRSVVLGFRAEDVRLGEGSRAPIRGTVTAIDRLGDMTHVHVSLTDEPRARMFDAPENKDNDNLNIAPRATGMLVARTSSNDPVETGQTVALTIDPERILWFDADSGKNISKD